MAPATAECIWLGKRDHIKADLVRKIATNKESWSRVNKKNPTIFPYLNCKTSRPPFSSNQNSEILSDTPADDWPNSSNEIREISNSSMTPHLGVLTNPIGLQDISTNNWETESDSKDRVFRVESSNLETQNSRTRVPSLRAVEALSANLHPQVDTHKTRHTQLARNDSNSQSSENVSLLPDPPSQRKMYSYPDCNEWIVSEEKELYSIVVKHKGFTYLLRKTGMNVLPSHFIYKYKRSPYGDLLSRKARFVAGGHKQEYEVDYFETYSATTQLESVRFMLAVAASRSLMLAKFDIETFFLYGKPDTDIFIEQLLCSVKSL